jgi:hypothetical protein
MKVKCDICGNRMKEPGALVFGAPIPSTNMVRKIHLCKHHAHELNVWIEEQKAIERGAEQMRRIGY